MAQTTSLYDAEDVPTTTDGYRTTNNPLVPANQGFGTSLNPLPSTTDLGNQIQDHSHPWIRGLALAATGALTAAALARASRDPGSDNFFKFPVGAALLGGLAGGAAGMGLNSTIANRAKNTILRNYNRQYASNQAFLKTRQGMEDDENNWLEAQGLQNSLQPFSAKGAYNLDQVQKMRESYENSAKPLIQLQQNLGGQGVRDKSLQQSYGPNPGGATPTPTTAGQATSPANQPSVTKTPDGRTILNTGAQTQPAPNYFDFASNPENWVTNEQRAGFDSHTPGVAQSESKIKLNNSQSRQAEAGADNYSAEAQLNRTRNIWYGPEAQSRINANNAKASKDSRPSSFQERLAEVRKLEQAGRIQPGTADKIAVMLSTGKSGSISYKQYEPGVFRSRNGKYYVYRNGKPVEATEGNGYDTVTYMNNPNTNSIFGGQ